MILAHAQKDFLLACPEESSHTAQQEADDSARKAESGEEIGISADKAHRGPGEDRASTEACTGCARTAGDARLDLMAAAEIRAAPALQRSVGFAEYGSSAPGRPEPVLMRPELNRAWREAKGSG